MLVLRGRDQNDQIPRSTLLPQRHAGGSGSGGVGRDPGGIRVLLANPRWGSRLLRFLELSGVGGFVEDGVDEDEAHAARMDDRVIWEAENEKERAM
jgi:hypothetical protein